MIVIPAKTQEDFFSISGEAEPDFFDISDSEGVFFRDKVAYHFDVQKTTKDIVITGRASTRVTFECVRCLKTFTEPFEVKDIIYSFVLDEIEDTIDITSSFREEFLLLLPKMPLCSESCKGLCPGCGADLAKEPCRCKKEKEPSPFDILDGLDAEE